MCGMPIQPVLSFSSDDLAPSFFSVLAFIITILYMLGFSSSSSSPPIFIDITDQPVMQIPNGESFLDRINFKKHQFLDHSSLSNLSASSARIYATLQPVVPVSADFSTSTCSSSRFSAAQSIIDDITVSCNQDSTVAPASVPSPIDAIRTAISVHLTTRHHASVIERPHGRSLTTEEALKQVAEKENVKRRKTMTKRKTATAANAPLTKQ